MQRSSTDNKEWLAVQKKVYSKWMLHKIRASDPSESELQITDPVEQLKDGIILSKLMRALSKRNLPYTIDAILAAQKSPFKLRAILGQLVDFIKSEGIQVTTSSENISSGDETLVMGLIWLLILKYQNINRTDQVGWVKGQLESYGIAVSDLTTSFQDGMAFASLVHSFNSSAIDLDAIKAMEIVARLDAAFNSAEQNLGIPRLLEPSDCYPEKPNERIIMTYLSFFHNVQRGSDSPRQSVVSSVPSTPDIKVVRSVTAPPTPVAVPVLVEVAELEKLRQENFELKNVKLDEAYKEIQTKSDQISDLYDKVAAAETQGQQRDKELEELKAKLSDRETALTQIKSDEIPRLESENSNLKTLFSELQSEKGQADSKISAQQADIDSKSSQIAEINAKLSAMESQAAEKETKITALESKLAELTASSLSGNEAAIELKKQIDETKRILEESQKSASEKGSKISSLEADIIPSLKKEIEGKDHEISSLRGDLAVKSQESDSNAQKLQSATDQLSEKTSKIAELESQLADLSTSGLDAVDGYKKQISDLKQQLDLAQEKLGEKDSKISSLEVDTVPLLKKEIDTKGQELAVLTDKLNESTQQAGSYAQEVKKADLQLVEKDAKISDLETKLADLSASASAESNAVQDLKKQLSESQSELAGKDSKISSLTSDVIPSLRSEIVEKDQVIASLRVDLESNQTKLEESNARISSNESKIAELEGKLSDLSASANAGNDAFASLKKELADSSQNLAAAQAKLDERDSQISSLQTEQIPKLKTETETLRAELDSARLQTADRDAQLQALNLSIVEKDSQLSSLKERNSASEAKLSATAEKLAETEKTLNSKVSDLEEKIKTLQDSNASDSTSASQSLALMKQEIEELKKSKSEIDAAKSKALSDLESAQQKEKSLVVELDELKQKAASMDASLQSAQAENNYLKSQIAELSSSSSDDINKLREKVVALETELPVVQSQRDQLLQSESHIQNQLSRAESSNENLKEEIQILKSKNLQLVKDMKTELVKLLDKQKEDATIMEMLKKKVASYSKTIIELQELIQSNNLANVDQMEAELSKLAVKNEDLMKKIAALEREIHEAQTKAEALMSSIAREESDSASETGTSLKDQLDAALNQVKELIEWRRRVLDQIVELKASQDDLSGLMASMDKMLKEKLKDLERMSKEKETLTVEVTKQVEVIKMIEVRNTEAEEKVQLLSNELDQLRKEKQALEASFDQLSGSLTTCNATVSEKSRQEAQLQESLKQAQQAAKDSSLQLEQLRSKLTETTEALSTCGNQCEKEKAEVSKLQARIMELERATPVTIAAHPLPHPVPFCSAASYSIVAVAACAAILGYFKYRDVE